MATKKPNLKDGLLPFDEVDITTDVIPNPDLKMPVSNKTTWADVSNKHPVGIVIDKLVGSKWISMTSEELLALLQGEGLGVEDILEFNAISGVKLKKTQMQEALNDMNYEASLAKNLQEGQDLAKMKQAKALTKNGDDEGIKYIWSYVPSSTNIVEPEDISTECPNCGISFMVPAKINKGGEDNE